MPGFLVRRLGASLLSVLLVVTATFFILHLAPGDPTRLVEGARGEAQRELLRQRLGLDRPLGDQYAVWLGNALRGDWGVSFVHGRPVAEVVAAALPGTLLLAAAALAVEYAAALLLGAFAARRPGSPADHAVRVGSLLFFSLPTFWLGLLAILLFSSIWPVLPASHMRSVDASALGPTARLFDLLRHLVLPACVLGLTNAGGTSRLVRNALIGTLSQDYVRTARAKGLSERRVLWAHALRNALVPITQIFALTLPALLNGALVTEVVFAWPGMGRLTFEALQTRDYPVVLATTTFSAVLVVAGSLLADLLLVAVDPRVRE